ncbi:alpha/beta hydrolase-fold protein [Zhouia spongiae]|uniref:Alpha/beta hydrolase-fold protein n=1 Tax=Zhouia spongiae TaxID=2202721 RepID=A0ABY3YI61_9FLAO|nr:alpha/beta hydrolase-fold protein [Zhouia spongiae]UNY97557.1 alpha/beta hydrolase-fold protein [Zhouia spongiae]
MRLFFLGFILLFLVQIHAQTTASVQVSTFIIEAPQLKTSKRIWIYLPKSYKNSNKRYPVIYMHDAQNLFDINTSYAGEWHIDESLDELNAEVIVVGIEHGNKKRIDELTPFEHPDYKGGKGKDYLDFIVETVKPHIDLAFRTLPDRKHTTIFGSSLGGLISFYALFEYNNTFGQAGVFSPSFWYSDKIFLMVENLKTLPDVKIYLATGADEGENMVPDQEKMVSLLLKKKLPSKNIKHYIVKNQKHNESFWGKEFTKAYKWLLKDCY